MVTTNMRFQIMQSQVLKADIILGIGPIFRIWEWGLMPLRIWMRNVLRIHPI